MRLLIKKIKYKESWFYVLVTKPDLYLYKLLTNTFVVGIVAFCLSFIYLHSGFSNVKIPTAMHSLVGIAIGFLLVFRANSSYDRWFEAKKNLASLSKFLNLFILKLNSCIKKDNVKSREKIKESLKSFIMTFQDYLKNNEIDREDKIKQSQNECIFNIMSEMKQLENDECITSKDLSSLETFLTGLFESSEVCQRIKDSPIPISFSLHIKVSIYIYILTLPFGLFYDLKLWSTFMVMIIFYIIYGIEIISSEIENPYFGDPNDLPIDDFTLKTMRFIDENIK